MCRYIPLINNVGDTVCDRARLARACSGVDQYRSVDVTDGRNLTI